MNFVGNFLTLVDFTRVGSVGINSVTPVVLSDWTLEGIAFEGLTTEGPSVSICVIDGEGNKGSEVTPLSDVK